MIQRIQTLHLLAVTALVGVLLFVPLAWFGDLNRTVTMYAFRLQIEPTVGEAVAAELSEVEAADPALAVLLAEAVAASNAETNATTEPMLPYLGVLYAVAALLSLATIFLYRRRLLQLRLCAVEVVLLIGMLVMEAVYYFRFKALFAEMAASTAHASMKLPMIFPLLALLFVLMAARAIFRDEMLVRAADRIR